MTPALSMTGADLVRALTDAVQPRVDRAARERAERVADAMREDGATVRVLRREAGAYEVERIAISPSPPPESVSLRSTLSTSPQGGGSS